MPKASKARHMMAWIAGFDSLGRVSVREVSADVAPERVKFLDERPWERGCKAVVPKSEIGMSRAEALAIFGAELAQQKLSITRQLDAINQQIATVETMKGEG